jgi:hypothetical protein
MAREYSRLYQSATHEAPYFQTHPVSVAGRMVIDVGMNMAKAWINACPWAAKFFYAGNKKMYFVTAYISFTAQPTTCHEKIHCAYCHAGLCKYFTCTRHFAFEKEW